ncbi:MAG: hypothetical protein FWE02_00775 [Defluviitaleaceae bacterium]|nr:hypothetical protein [Defluviitaleaceae bacterium]
MSTNFLASNAIPTLSDEGLARHLNRGVRKALEGLEPALRVEVARQARGSIGILAVESQGS